VSVVATGIEAEIAQQPQPGKVFAFPRTTTATPVAAVPVTPPPAPTPTMEEEAEVEDTLELTDEMDEGDELVLDSDDVLTAPVGSAPIAPPADEEEADMETPLAEEKPKVRETGTLFERMSNIARGAAQAQVNDEDATPSYRREPIDIPRFLNRQNNQ
jgi:cell division protein FtsZ